MNPYVLLLRSFLPLTIFRYPLLGAVLSILADSIDWNLTNFNTPHAYEKYQVIDKVLDTYYLSIEANVALKFENQLIRNASIILYAYRILGLIIFSLTQNRLFLVIFPSLFEFLFIFYLSYKKIFKKELEISFGKLLLLLIVLLIPKMIQEYSAHIAKRPPWEWEN